MEPATFRFVAQHLNHCATAVHNPTSLYTQIYEKIATYFSAYLKTVKTLLAKIYVGVAITYFSL